MVESVVETEDIPAPAITLKPASKSTAEYVPETIEDFYYSMEKNLSYSFEEVVISDTLNQTWGKHLDLIGKERVHYMVNSSRKLTTNAETSISIEFSQSFAMEHYYVSTMFHFPFVYLFDQKYDRMGAKLLSVPYEYVDFIDFVDTAARAVIYLEVR